MMYGQASAPAIGLQAILGRSIVKRSDSGSSEPISEPAPPGEQCGFDFSAIVEYMKIDGNKENPDQMVGMATDWQSPTCKPRNNVNQAKPLKLNEPGHQSTKHNRFVRSLCLRRLSPIALHLSQSVETAPPPPGGCAAVAEEPAHAALDDSTESKSFLTKQRMPMVQTPVV
eukprot:SAG11_NODE_2362_length_3460_cov_2.653675_3_plen_171_part_00